MEPRHTVHFSLTRCTLGFLASQTQNNCERLFSAVPPPSFALTSHLPPFAVYLVTDLCQGGELFDRICALQYFKEQDAAKLVKTVMSAVDYLHSHGIVHRGTLHRLVSPHLAYRHN
jgi:serine/threonine protein kinase